MTTVGELITELFDRYRRVFGDDHKAALATQERVHAALRRRAHTAATLVPRRSW